LYDQVAELVGIHEEKLNYRKYHPAGTGNRFSSPRNMCVQQKQTFDREDYWSY